jgi:hypothetical protein
LKKLLFVLLIALIFLFACTDDLIRCGDGKCHSLHENIESCPEDCDPNYGKTLDLCGNEIIDEGENCFNCPEDVVCGEGFECIQEKCLEIKLPEPESVPEENESNEITNEEIELKYNFISEKISSNSCDDKTVLKALKVVLGENINLNKRLNPFGSNPNESFCSIKSNDGTALYELIFSVYQYDETVFKIIQDEKEQILIQWFNSIERPYLIGRESYLFEQIQPKESFFRILFVASEKPLLVNIRAVKQTNLIEAKAVGLALNKII